MWWGGERHSHTPSSLTLWNVFIRVWWQIPCDTQNVQLVNAGSGSSKVYAFPIVFNHNVMYNVSDKSDLLKLSWRVFCSDMTHLVKGKIVSTNKQVNNIIPSKYVTNSSYRSLFFPLQENHDYFTGYTSAWLLIFLCVCFHCSLTCCSHDTACLTLRLKMVEGGRGMMLNEL